MEKLYDDMIIEIVKHFPIRRILRIGKKIEFIKHKELT